MERRITPSLVISIIALVVALGGASYAAIKIPKNSVGTKQLKNKAVNSNKVKDGSLLLKDFKGGQVKPNAYEGERPPSLLLIPASFSPIVGTGQLPKGNYVVMGRANILASSGTTNVVLCSLGDDAAQNFTVPANGIFPLSMNGTVSLATPQAVTMNCLKTAGAPEVAQAHVIAIPINGLSKTTFGP